MNGFLMNMLNIHFGFASRENSACHIKAIQIQSV